MHLSKYYNDFCFDYSLTWQTHTSKGSLVLMPKILREALLPKNIF